MLLMIDNYDSFTYNLVQYFYQLGQEVEVHRNDLISLDDIEKKSPEYIVISPGPCTPKEAGISVDLIKKFKDKLPILGVCLGHQCLGAAFGANIIGANEIMHGKLSEIIHDGSGLFKGVENSFKATRYHSLIIEEKTLDKDFHITAWTENKTIMAIQHEKLPLFGLQFHPESIATEQGMEILRNFLSY
ncbi:MAG: aminodeoxychorismate/anthranilate synthase component II [SAR86 cluster bacterium]|jgi:anthranilate synthase component 2|nr:aminodeoxychorismate/anthranilate synthase component II [SAR86 cluster bacterium]